MILIFLLVFGLSSYSALSETTNANTNDNAVLSDYALDIQQGKESIANDQEAQNNQARVLENEIVSGRDKDRILTVETKIHPWEVRREDKNSKNESNKGQKNNSQNRNKGNEPENNGNSDGNSKGNDK